MNKLKLCALPLLAVLLPVNVNAAVGIANDVQPGTIRDVYTNTGGNVSITSAVISQGECVITMTTTSTTSGSIPKTTTISGDTSVHHQRILKSGVPITSDLSVPAGGSFQVVFNPPVVMGDRDTISVQNGSDNSPKPMSDTLINSTGTQATSCTTNFLLQGQ